MFAHVTVPSESPELQRRVHVLAAPCRHHPRHGTGRSGERHLPRSGRKDLLTSPCRGMRPRYQGVFTCSRHVAVTIRDTGQERPDQAICRGPDESVCARHRAVGCARGIKACSRARGTMPSPSARRHGGPDELLPKVRTKVFVDVTVPLESPDLPMRVHHRHRRATDLAHDIKPGSSGDPGTCSATYLNTSGLK